jgi:hypothetical protein
MYIHYFVIKEQPGIYFFSELFKSLQRLSTHSSKFPKTSDIIKWTLVKTYVSLWSHIKTITLLVRLDPNRRPRNTWEDNIKMDRGEIGWVGMNWIDLARDRDQWKALVNMVMNLRVP